LLEELDVAFHAALYKPCNNARLLVLIEELRREDRGPYREQPAGSATRAKWSRQHRKMLTKCAAGDAASAVAVLEEHLPLRATCRQVDADARDVLDHARADLDQALPGAIPRAAAAMTTNVHLDTSVRPTAWLTTQSDANPSQASNSLVTGKLTGNFANLGLF
jgi:hypothetical protein